jgi:haloalkane dehalogenase
MAMDLDERFALRFPGLSRRLFARAATLPPESPIRRDVLKRAFRTHSGTSHPAGGVYRTPEDRFQAVPDFDYEPQYRQVGDLRLAHIDAGEGEPVLMLHGQPAWSFIWRKVIPRLCDAGYRCIAPDHAGCGRSDKPIDSAWHTLERHVELTASLVEELDLHDLTLIAHDWGGPIGLMLAMAYPDRIGRIVVLDTAIDPREAWMNKTWLRVRDFILSTEEFAVAELMRANGYKHLTDDVLAAYQAPYPVPESQGSFKGFMTTIPSADDKNTAAAAETFYDLLRRDQRPMLILWGESDVFLTLASGQRFASRIGSKIDHVIPQAGHGLLEDQGEMIGDLIADWLRSTD